MIACHASNPSLLRRGSTVFVLLTATGAATVTGRTSWRAATRQCSRIRQYHKRAHLGSVTTSDASRTRIADLLQKIKPLDQVTSGNVSLLMLLTPGFAKHARDAELPVKLVDSLHAGKDGPASLDSIVAVVDALPPTTQHLSPAEGIAFIVQEGTSTQSVVEQSPIRKSAQRAGSLNFDLPISSQQRWRLQMPLSQTIFSTGLTSTLVSRSHAAGQGKLSREEYLESLTFSMPQQSNSDECHVDCPLVQLTSYRTVQNSMGNIIRTLSSHDGQKSQEEPASRNLEEAVADYFKALDMPPEPVNVWALIIPRSVVASGTVKEATDAFVVKNHDLRQLWLKSKADSRVLQTLLERQARLVKVLSGGGGWGKKAGLLSLDPDLEYSTRELRDDHGWDFDFDQTGEDGTLPSMERQLDQALGSSVEEGDGIVFFVAPKLAAPESADTFTSADTLSFGICEDANASNGVSRDEMTGEQAISYRENSFGMYSATGMALQIRENDVLINKTKLEVPGLRVLLHGKDCK